MKFLPCFIAIATFITTLSTFAVTGDVDRLDQAGSASQIALLSPQDDESRALPFNTKKHRMKKIKKDEAEKDHNPDNKIFGGFFGLFDGDDDEETSAVQPTPTPQEKEQSSTPANPIKDSSKKQAAEQATTTESETTMEPAQPVKKEKDGIPSKIKGFFSGMFNFLKDDGDDDDKPTPKSTAAPFDTKAHRRARYMPDPLPESETNGESSAESEMVDESKSKSMASPFDTKAHRRSMYTPETGVATENRYDAIEEKQDTTKSKSTAAPFDSKKHGRVRSSQKED